MIAIAAVVLLAGPPTPKSAVPTPAATIEEIAPWDFDMIPEAWTPEEAAQYSRLKTREAKRAFYKAHPVGTPVPGYVPAPLTDEEKAIVAGKPTPTPHVPTRKELEATEKFDKARTALDALNAHLEGLSKQQQIDCMKAIGRAPFCSCLHDVMAVGVSFDVYVLSNTHPDEELGTIDHAYVENARAARDKCAGK